MYSLFILVFLFLFTTIHPKYFCKSRLFLKFWMLHEKSSFITSFVEQPVFSTLKMCSVLILLFLFFFFFLPRFIQNSSAKVIFSGNFRFSAEGAVISLLSWRNLYIAFQNLKCTDFSFFILTYYY